MAKISSPKKLDIDSVPSSHRDWVQKSIFEPLNPLIQQVVTTLQNGIEILDNQRSVKILAVINVGQTWPMTHNLKTLKGKPSVVHIGALRTLDGTSIDDPFSLTWSYNDGLLNWKCLGLNTSSKYEITLYAII